MSLPWTIELRRNHDETFSGRIVELPGCMTEGKDELETLAHLREALELWLETELERGMRIPKPGEYQSRRRDFSVQPTAKVASRVDKARRERRATASARR